MQGNDRHKHIILFLLILSIGVWMIISTYFSLERSLLETADRHLLERKTKIAILLDELDLNQEDLNSLNLLWEMELEYLYSCDPYKKDLFSKTSMFNPLTHSHQLFRKLETQICHQNRLVVISLYISIEEKEDLIIVLLSTLFLLMVLVLVILVLFPLHKIEVNFSKKKKVDLEYFY